MIHLWLNFPRKVEAGARSGVKPTAPTDFRNRVAALWQTNGNLPRLLLWFAHVTDALYILAAVALLAFITYRMVISIDPENRNSIMSLVGGFWAFAICLLLFFVVLLVTMWDWTLKGHPQLWLLGGQGQESRPMVAAVLDGIRGALRERESSRPHDQCFALEGILDACGAPEQRLDYGQSVEETYRSLFETLVRWQPGALVLLLDAGGCSSTDRPSWIPRWDEATMPSQWLSARYRVGLDESAVPHSHKPSYVLSGPRLTPAGPVPGRGQLRTLSRRRSCRHRRRTRPSDLPPPPDLASPAPRAPSRGPNAQGNLSRCRLLRARGPQQETNRDAGDRSAAEAWRPWQQRAICPREKNAASVEGTVRLH